jgi:hypothetical protein
MPRPTLPDMGLWRRQPLTIPPDSLRAWMRLVAWQGWMGVVLCCTLTFAERLIASARNGIVTVYDFTNCYTIPPASAPCERVVYRAGTLNVAFNVWCGVLLLGAAAWLAWEVWTAAAPKPVTDDFLKLLDDSFARDWRKPRTWPWARVMWAYGFTLVGALAAAGVGLVVSSSIGSSRLTKPAIVHVETSQRFRLIR